MCSQCAYLVTCFDSKTVLFVYTMVTEDDLQGVPQYWAHFAFCYFVSFYSTKIQKLGEF